MASVAEVLATGHSARADVVQVEPLALSEPGGPGLYTVVLNVRVPGEASYQVTVGGPVPADAVPVVVPGADLPVRVLPPQPGRVAVDFAAAVTEAGPR